MHPVGVLIDVITSLISQYSDMLRLQGALGNVIWPFLRSTGHAERIFPEHCKSIRIANESQMPIKWSHTIVTTFLKMCIGSNKWLILKSSQYGNLKNMDSLQRLHKEKCARLEL
jgi:hypothetical protein